MKKDNTRIMNPFVKHKRVIVIDNYDSFTYNLVHIVEELLQHPITVKRNDEVTLKEINDYDYIILSPGPGLPEEAGLLKDIIKTWGSNKNTLGVCLGLQAIGEVYGAELYNLADVYHGVSTLMNKTNIDTPIFKEVPETFEAGRYHSWVINKKTLPKELLITASDDEGQIMAIHHKNYPVYGVQFHPESIMTPHGKTMIANFLALPVHKENVISNSTRSKNNQ